MGQIVLMSTISLSSYLSDGAQQIEDLRWEDLGRNSTKNLTEAKSNISPGYGFRT